MGFIANILGLRKAGVKLISENEMAQIADRLTSVRTNLKIIDSSKYKKIITRYSDILNNLRLYRQTISKIEHREKIEDTTRRIEVATLTVISRELISKLRISLIGLGVALDDMEKADNEIANSAREILTPVFVRLGTELGLSAAKITALTSNSD